MKDEIKEILDEISNEENYSNFIDGQSGGTEHYLLLEKKEGKQLLDYITNLQTIEQQYSAILSENAELENKITNLQSKIDKAIEILDKYAKTEVEDYKKIIKFYKELRNVLKEDKRKIVLDKIKELKGE